MIASPVVFRILLQGIQDRLGPAAYDLAVSAPVFHGGDRVRKPTPSQPPKRKVVVRDQEAMDLCDVSDEFVCCGEVRARANALCE